MKIALSIIAVTVLNVISSSHIFASSRSVSDNRSLLEQLDKLVAERSSYMDKRRAKADSVEILINETVDVGRQLQLYLEQARLWSGISSDSAVSVCNRGLHLSMSAGDSTYVQEFFIERASAFFNRGQVHDCIDDLNHVENVGLRPGIERHFHYVGFAIYLTLGAFYEHDEQWTNYLAQGRRHLIAHKRFLGNDSCAVRYCDALINMVDGKKKVMASNLLKVVSMTDESDEIYPYANTVLGEYFMGAGNYDEAVYYYAKGAITNIRNYYCPLKFFEQLKN